MSRSTNLPWSAVACFLLGMAGPPAARAEVILGPEQLAANPAPYFRFSGGYPDNPAATTNNPSFYLSTLDFSGVGWKLPGIFGPGGGSGWNVAMIDNTHFIGAWHVHNLNGVVNMDIGDTLNFRPAGSTNTIVQRTIANLQQVPNADTTGSDVMLGTLNASIAGTGVSTYPIAAAGVSQQVIYAYGRQSEVGQNNFGQIATGAGGGGLSPASIFVFDYDQPNSNPDSRPVLGFPSANEGGYQAGDSGSPVFVLVGGQLQLLGAAYGTISYGDPGQQPKPANVVDPLEFSAATYLPDYVAQINALAVPEPGSLALGLCAGSGILAGYMRSRRRAEK
jgi:hypothetical protein